MRWGEDVEYAYRHNSPLPGEETAIDDRPLRQAIKDYLDLMEQDPRRSRHTILTDRVTGKRLIDNLGRKTLRNLRREDIEEYKRKRLMVVGPSSVRQDMSMLSRIYETARIDWRIEGLSYPGANVKLPSPPPNRKLILAEYQFTDLFDACKASKNPMLYPLVFLLLNTGMRPEEAVLLRWQRVLWKENTINLTKTKTEPRRVPLSQSSVDLLSEMYRAAPIKTGYVFISEETAKKDMPVRFFRRAFEQACIRAGINTAKKRDVGKKAALELEDIDNGSRVTLYTLRHSAATYMIMAGGDIRTVADILGHSNISQTVRYTHMADDHKRKVVNLDGLPWNTKKP